MHRRKTDTLPVSLIVSLTVVRIILGWHFLYEGIVKLLMPNWSAAQYLTTSTWIFSGIFRSIAGLPSVVPS